MFLEDRGYCSSDAFVNNKKKRPEPEEEKGAATFRTAASSPARRFSPSTPPTHQNHGARGRYYRALDSEDRRTSGFPFKWEFVDFLPFATSRVSKSRHDEVRGGASAPLARDEQLANCIAALRERVKRSESSPTLETRRRGAATTSSPG
ncbi:hypothetical protein EYF80_018725 [Liparis tanakae]|uniref:Uncharacterized protein n=1 Tax=Liparis tanakae TaxID=230148 RepID=A0A4Z2I1A8_9TELE|nr:hypothetical protein EYF80_018725 [Liparis tanakae]